MPRSLIYRSCLFLTMLASFATPQLLLAQPHYNNGAAAGGIFTCCASLGIGVPIAILALSVAMLVWVNKDAKARGMENSVVWMLLVFFTNFLGLIVYLLSRPKGELTPCPRCGEKKLPMLVKCPHCGASV